MHNICKVWGSNPSHHPKKVKQKETTKGLLTLNNFLKIVAQGVLRLLIL